MEDGGWLRPKISASDISAIKDASKSKKFNYIFVSHPNKNLKKASSHLDIARDIIFLLHRFNNLDLHLL